MASHPAVPVLSRRALNRALLARQHLLERTSEPALDLVEHLVGLQAQNPGDPYVALWSRLGAFDPADLAAAIADRRAVRMGMLRTTLHLVTRRDAVAMWPLVRPVLHRAWQSSPYRRDLGGLAVEEVVGAARDLLVHEPLTTAPRRPARRALARPEAGLARVRGALPPADRPGPAARAVGGDGPGDVARAPRLARR